MEGRVMTGFTEFYGKLAIGVGGSLVGLIAGWDVGPLSVELGRTYLALLGAVGGGLFVMTCTCWATERAQANAERQRQIDRLAWVARQVGAIRIDVRALAEK
jgi:hypothetical protein